MIVLRAEHTKSRRPDERPTAGFLKPYLERSIQMHRFLQAAMHYGLQSKVALSLQARSVGSQGKSLDRRLA